MNRQVYCAYRTHIWQNWTNEWITVKEAYKGNRVKPTLQATRWGHNLPKPSGGWMRLSNVTTSRCFILPLEATHINYQIPNTHAFSKNILCSAFSVFIRWILPEKCFNLLCLRVVFWPYPFELIQMMWTQDGPVTCQIIKVIHNDSHK